MLFSRRYLPVLVAIFLAVAATGVFFSRGETGIRASLSAAVGAALGDVRVFLDWRAGIPFIVRGKTIIVRVARTDEEHSKGLGGIRRLSGDKGLLYVYPYESFYTHSMKDMLFPLDIIWIDADKKIVDVITDVLPDTYPDYMFVNDYLAQYVLEIPAGFFKKHGLELGDAVEFEIELKR